MNENTTHKNCSVDAGLILTIILIVAKVWGNAPISWLFCFAPLLITLGFTLVVLAFVFVVFWLNNRNYLL